MFGAIGDVRMDDLVMVDMTGIVAPEHSTTNRLSTATPSRPASVPQSPALSTPSRPDTAAQTPATRSAATQELRTAGRSTPPSLWTVRFHANGGTGTMADETFVWGSRRALTANAFSRSGYEFVGWSRRKGGQVEFTNKQAVSNLASAPNGVVTLYAVWQGVFYTVVFHSEFHHGTTMRQTLRYGTKEALRANPFTCSGHEFAGWSKTPGGALFKHDRQEVQNLTPDAGREIHLYALWAVVNDPGVVLCLGDSITQGYACAGLPYPARLARLSGLTVINRGVGGTTSGDGLRTAERNIVAAQAATVCIQFGANDAIHGISARTTKENLRQIIRLCRKYDCRPILATPTHQSGRHARFNDGVNDIVAAVRALAREEDVTLVDLNAAFGGNDRYLNPDDGLHLSEAGGDLMARMFYEAL